MRLGELADLTGGKVSGNPDTEITGVAGIQEAGKGDITFLAGEKYLKDLRDSDASAVITKEELEGITQNMLVSENPQLTFAKALELFYVKPYKPLGISEKAFIGAGTSLGKDVSIHPFAYISDGAVIGSQVSIFPGAFIGEHVIIGDNSVIHPNVTIRENVRIGENVIIHSGSVIGSDGFGYLFDKDRHYKIPQVGSVMIENNVEIGANVSIDRATTGNTIIGSGTKIDNLTQIAHNVKIGKNCVIVSQVGISGSVELGEGVVLGGQVGVRDHMKIGAGAMVGAQSGIATDIPEKQIYTGRPAILHAKWLRAQSIYSRLPEFIKRLQDLERKAGKEE